MGCEEENPRADAEKDDADEADDPTFQFRRLKECRREGQGDNSDRDKHAREDPHAKRLFETEMLFSFEHEFVRLKTRGAGREWGSVGRTPPRVGDVFGHHVLNPCQPCFRPKATGKSLIHESLRDYSKSRIVTRSY